MFSCAREGSVTAEVDTAGWRADAEYSVIYDNRDSLSPRELSVFVFHDQSLASSVDPLLLTITTITPDSIAVSEEWPFYPDRPGAEEASPFHETARPYRSRVVLNRKGPYTFKFSHRNPIPVKGIKGIGVTIDSR